MNLPPAIHHEQGDQQQGTQPGSHEIAAMRSVGKEIGNRQNRLRFGWRSGYGSGSGHAPGGGQPGDAVNYLKVAYQRAPGAPRINFYLGEAYRLTGDKVKARRHLMKALNRDAKEAWRDRASMALAMVGQ